MTVRCGHPTLDGEPCENPVASGSDHCAAMHPVNVPKPVASASALGVTAFELDDVATYGSGASSPELKLANFRKVLDSDEAYRIIDSHEVLRGGTWNAGSCRVLARALIQVMPEARIWTVVDASMHPEPQHYVVQLPDGRFVDGDGVSTRSQLIERLEKDELLQRCRLVEGELSSSGIPAPATAVNEVAAFLWRQLVCEEAW